MSLVTPQRGLMTPGGFKPAPIIPAMVDQAAEAQKCFDRIGDYLDMIEIAYNDILVAKYIPETLGSLLASEQTQKEQRWQNKVGLVLKYGPTSKQDGFTYEAKDWVFYRPSDGQEIGLKCKNDQRVTVCLILSPAHIIGKVTNPDVIW